MTRSQQARPRAGALPWVLAGLVLSASGAAAHAQAGGGAKPAPLARYFPREDLIAYAEFDGLDNHADAWHATAAYRVLTETATGAMLDDLALQAAGRFAAAVPGQALSARELRDAAEHAARRGLAFGVVRKPGAEAPACVGVVIRGAASGRLRELIDKVLATGHAPDAKRVTLAKARGRSLVVEGGGGEGEGETRPGVFGGLTWWVEGDDLAFSVLSSAGADLMIDALDGGRPSAVGSPALAPLASTEGDFTPVAFGFCDAAALPALPPDAAAYGIDKVKRIEYRWGFQGEALATFTRVVVPAPRSGLLAVFDLPAFDRKAMPGLPAGLTRFATLSTDPAALYDRLAEGFAANGPAQRAAFDAFAMRVREATGQRLRDDVLAHLGPKLTYYTAPTKVDAPANPLSAVALGVLRIPKAVVLVDVKDADAFAKVLDATMKRLAETIKAGADESGQPPVVRVRPLKGVDHGYALSLSTTALPIPAGMKPTIVLGKKSLVVASTPEAAREALAVEGGGHGLPAGDPLARPFDRLPGGLIFASVSDTSRSLLPEIVANLPGLIRWYSTGPRLGWNVAFAPGMVRRVPGRPNAPTFAFSVDPDNVPSPDDLRPFLSASTFTLTADDQGFRFATHEPFPALNPVALAPVAAALVFPAMQSSRAAARRSQSVNNMKQMGLAMHNYHSSYNHFPPQATADKDGKPRLSWRVAILPFLEQQALYNEFHLDEPWDSPHNKTLVARMPAVFAVPGSKADPGKTFYRGFSGDLALFDPKAKEGVGLQNVTDGTSNTIGIVEAKTAVFWTKPDDEIPFNPANAAQARQLLNAVGGHFPGGFNALFLDGSVRFIKQTIAPQVFRALITRAGGEVVSADAY